jgi:hypothetical protein
VCARVRAPGGGGVKKHGGNGHAFFMEQLKNNYEWGGGEE